MAAARFEAFGWALTQRQQRQAAGKSRKKIRLHSMKSIACCFFFLLALSLPLAALHPVEMAGAEGATRLLAGDNGGAYAIIPAEDGAGAGIYAVTDSGKRGIILLTPVRGPAVDTASDMALSSSEDVLWAVSSCSIKGQTSKGRINRMAADGEKTNFAQGIINDASDISLQRLLPISDTQALLHDADCLTASLVSYFTSGIVKEKEMTLPLDCGFRPAIAGEEQIVYYPTTVNGNIKLLSYDVTRKSESIVVGMLGPIESYLTKSSGTVEKSDKRLCAVDVSADGKTLVFRWANGAQASSTLGVHVALLCQNEDGSWPDEVTVVDECHSKGDYRPVCGDFDVSADGRMVAYCAPDEAAPHRLRAWRYDVVTASRICLSEGLDADCAGISISSNGRFVTFLADGKAYRSDCGMDLRCEAEKLKVAPGTKSMVVPLEFHGALENEKATMTVVNDSGCPGSFMVDDTPVTAGIPFVVTAESRLCYLPGAAGQGEGGIVTFTLQNESGLSSSISIEITITGYDELARVTTGAYVAKLISALAFDAESKTVAADILSNFNGCTSGGVFAINTDNLQVSTRAEMTTARRLPVMAFAAFSGDVVTVDNHGALWRNARQLETGKTFSHQVAPAVSADGSRMAALQEDASAVVVMDGDGNVISEVRAVDESKIIAFFMDYSGDMLSVLQADGRLFAVFSADWNSPAEITSGVEGLCGMTMDGSRVLYKAGDGRFSLRVIANTQPLPLEGIPATATDVGLSANGCYVCWHDGSSNALALLEQSEESIQASLSSEFTGTTGVRMLSSDGRMLAFAGNTADFAKAGETGTGIYLYTQSSWSVPASAYVLWNDVHALEDEPAELEIAYSGEAACITEVKFDDETLHGTAELLGPDGTSPYARLRYTPTRDYVGDASFQVRFWNGNAWSEWQQCDITVDDVNDPPVWVTKLPVETSLVAGGNGTFQLQATDVDTGNPVPDDIRYQLKQAPEWVSVDAESGVVTLKPPMDTEVGKYRFYAEALDEAGASSGDGEVVVSVAAAAPQEFTADELLAAAGTVEKPMDTAEAWHQAVCGCWASLKDSEAGWKALSLPGDVECADICRLLGCDEIWRWTDDRWQNQETGILPGGAAFWCRFSGNLGTERIRIAPVLKRTLDAPGFYGALVEEKLPAGADAATPTTDGWTQSHAWQMGGAAFIRP